MTDKKEKELDGLDLLRKPFEPHQISKLPKPTKKQTEEIKADYKKGIRCKICGQWHHPDVIHLDYVGHAALTDRLLECDINWTWEPMAYHPHGGPLLDQNGGLWIKLTVCGMTRLGYGHADGKLGGDAVKEAIGDALRNAAMRFGAALDLWHKGDLYVGDTKESDLDEKTKEEPKKPQKKLPDFDPESPKVQPAQSKELVDLCNALGFKQEALAKKYNREYIAAFSVDEYNHAKENLENLLKK